MASETAVTENKQPASTYDLQHLEMAQVRALYDLVRRGLAHVQVTVAYVDLTSIPKKPRQKHPKPEQAKA